MLRIFLFISLLVPLRAQLLIETFAGGQIPPGALGDVAGLTWDSVGNIIYCDSSYNVIRRLHPDGTVETIAGSAIHGFSGDGGPATDAVLNSPRFPAYDASGNLYFLDNARIRRIDTKGVITTIAGDGETLVPGLDSNGAATARSLPGISGLTVDGLGNVYFADQTNGLIQRVTPAGFLETFAQVQVSSQAIAADAAGNVYVFAQPTNLLRISPNGTIANFATLSFREFAPAELNGLATDPEGNVYVSAATSGQLLRFSPDGSSVTTTELPPSFTGPMTIDAQGNVGFPSSIPRGFDVSVPVIQELTAQSTLKTLYGADPQPAPDGTPLRNAWFLGPTSIAFSSAGDLYVAESGACLIRKISAAGVLSTFAGTGICGSSAPSGNAQTANLASPYSIAIDSMNRVWVADLLTNLYSMAQDGTLSAILRTPVAGGDGQLAIDSKDRVYVLSRAAFYRLLADGTFQAIVAPPTGPGMSGPLTDLLGLGVDPSGNVYFQGGQNLYVVNDDGAITQKSSNPVAYANSLAIDSSGQIWQGDFSQIDVSGTNGLAQLGNLRGYSGDGGFALSAGFSAVSSLAFSPSGTLYFLDAGRIRRFTGAGPATAPVISQNGIVNAASYTGGPLAPGELVSIFGSNFGPSSLQVNTPVNNTVPYVLGRTRVLFNDLPAAVTAVTPTQINVFVPYFLGSAGSVRIVVQVDDQPSAPITMPLAQAAPGLSTSDSSGSGQGAILNQDGSLNSGANPALRGSIISLFGTGEGLMMPQLYDGSLALSTPFSAPVNQVSVTIAGQPATVLYSGDAPSLPTGVFQINAMVPANINPGPSTILVTVGGSTTTQRVTVAVR